MSAQNRYATLESDLMGKGADGPPAPPARRRTAERLTGRATALSAAPSAPAATPTEGTVFYDKGAATAANFRPSYWTYERAAPGDAPQNPAAAAVPATPHRIDLAPALPASIEQEAERAAEADPAEPPAVVGGRLDTASVAGELAATIEHVLDSRYSGARHAPESTPKPRAMGSAVTADSLMAELAAARQTRSAGDKAAVAQKSSRVPKKAPSLFDRAFVLGGIALVLFALLALSPWRDSLLSPNIAQFFG